MTDIEEEKIIEYIMLSQMKGFGPVTQNTLLDVCGGIESCFTEDSNYLFEHEDIAKRIGKRRIEKLLIQKADRKLREQAEQIYKNAGDYDIKIITRESNLFPERFRGISDMPILLYFRGSLLINDFRDSIGIVGARRCTAEGKEKTIEIATEAVTEKAAVISGMAKGIDSYAHTAALKQCGYTVAVLGCGSDICYPKEHFRLYERIAEMGCLLSEYPPGTQPREYNFPQRNRLIAALSDELYVIDAGRGSGTESTVKACKRYGRNVKVL